jgi:hypothetical protein
VLQVNPHEVPSHVAVAFAGTVQAVHRAPHVETLLLDAQLLPHGWKPPPHVNPHEVPSHVAVAFAGGEQVVHDVDPQLAMLVLAAHVLPHRW